MTAVLSLHRLNNNNGCLLAGRRQSEGRHFSAYDTLRPVPHPMYLHMQRNAADQQAMGTRHIARRGELLDTYHVAFYSVELAWLSAYLYYQFRFRLRRAVPRTRGCAAIACCRAEPTPRPRLAASGSIARKVGNSGCHSSNNCLRPSHRSGTMLEQTRKAAHLYTLFVLPFWWLEGKHTGDSLPHNSAPSVNASWSCDR
jgi:hypothetical protein